MYTPTEWKDRIVTKPKTYNIIANEDGTRTLDDAPGEVLQEGTPLSAVNLNKIEQALVEVFGDAKTLFDAIRTIATDGVKAFGTNLSVEPGGAGLTVTIQPGAAMVQTHPYILEAAATLALSAAEANPRIDRVVVRLDTTGSDTVISLAIRKGTAAVTPATPALVRTGGIYELSLAKVSVAAGASSIVAANITDERQNEAVCGAITPEIMKISALVDRLREVGGLSSNPNLLINGDFQVWQRGTSFTTSGVQKYTADRWKMTNNLPSVSKITNGLRVQFTQAWQAIIQSRDDLFFQAGTTLTISVLVKSSVARPIGVYLYINGGATAFGGAVANVTTDYTTIIATITLNEDVSTFGVLVQPTTTLSSDVDIQYVKLEKGIIATPLSPRAYAEEFAMCQRYYQFYNQRVNGAYLSSANSLHFLVPYQKPLRIAPTIFVDVAQVYPKGSGEATGFTCTATNFNLSQMYITANKTAHGLSANDTWADFKVRVDAEIY